MESSASSITTTKHDFDKRVADVKAPKRDINALILDYLALEGYPNAAANFSREANLPPHQGNDSIRKRQEIKHSIHRGRIQEAIEALNEFDPEILDGNPDMHFDLLRLQLIELIRTCVASPGGDIEPALSFATTQLGPRVPAQGKFLDDLEMAMSLLVFPHDSLEPELAALLDPSLRRQVADSVNEAILQRLCHRREAALRQLIRMRVWAEDTARDKNKNLPAKLDLGIGVGVGREDRPENGHDPMVT